MKVLTNLLMKGLATVLPIGLTIYAIWWLVSGAESVMHALIHLIAPQTEYRPGMGILSGVVVTIELAVLIVVTGLAAGLALALVRALQKGLVARVADEPHFGQDRRHRSADQNHERRLLNASIPRRRALSPDAEERTVHPSSEVPGLVDLFL